MSGQADPGGVHDHEKSAKNDAPGMDGERTPAGMELTFQTPTTEGAVFYDDEPVTPATTYGEPYQEQQGKVSFAPPAKTTSRPRTAANPRPSAPRQRSGQPKQFREQFDHLMKRLEDRFQNERLGLEEKHSRELEDAMGYFSLSSNEREAKQHELQAALLEDIGDMAQQLHELTGALGSEGDAESLTLPSDPKVLEQYAHKMQNLEDQFQREKEELEQKHASEMEEALGTLRLTREQREAKQLELQDEIQGEIGDMAKQLEELKYAKDAYESKMGIIKQQLSKEEPTRARQLEDPKLQSMNRRLSDVERERDAAHEELRRLKLALQVTQGDGGSYMGSRQPDQYPGIIPQPRNRDRPLSPEEQSMISGLRGRIEQIEKELKQAAQAPGGSNMLRPLRQRMKLIENDLETAEESTKEHFALAHLRARLEKVERLLTEGERAAKDWEALEQLRHKIGNVDNDLKAVEEAKREFEALEALRSKMEAVENELKAAEQLATDRQSVDKLRQRLGQVERELGVAEPPREDREEPASIDKLLARLKKAESSLQDARQSTLTSQRPSEPVSAIRGNQMAERDNEVERILQRLAIAESKLNAAKESAQRRNPNTGSGYPNLPFATSQTRPPPRSFTPFDERQSKMKARLQEHFDESDPRAKGKEEENKQQPTTDHVDARVQPPSNMQRVERVPRTKFEEPRTVGSRNRYFVQDVQLDRDVPLRSATFEDGTIPTQEPTHLDGLEEKDEPEVPGATTRPLRRMRAGEPAPGSNVGGVATRPLRRRYAGEAPEIATNKPSRPPADYISQYSMPNTVLGDNEDRYAADLEEIRYQRALLSQKLPRNRMGEEEKKSDDSATSAPKYSFKEALRNGEKQRLREQMNPRVLLKKPTSGSKLTAELPKEMSLSSTVEAASKPEQRGTTDAEEAADETQSKPGGDPPMKAASEAIGDPPPQVPSLEKELKTRLLSQKVESGRDPHPANNTKARTSLDPPAHVDPPQRVSYVAHTTSITPFTGVALKEHPSDEKNGQAKTRPVKQTEAPVEDEDESMLSADLPGSARPDASVSTPQESSKVSVRSEASSVAPPRNRPSRPSEETHRQEPPQEPLLQIQYSPPPPPARPRQPQVQPAAPPSPAASSQSSMQFSSQRDEYLAREFDSPPHQVTLQNASQTQRLSPRPSTRDASQQYNSWDRDEPQMRPLPPPSVVQQPLQTPPPPQQPIFHQTTVVDGKAAARERREKDRLMRWVVLILLCIAIILAVVIIVVIVLLRNNDDNVDKVGTPVPTIAPRPTPPLFPTSAPTMNGTMENMTMSPTPEGTGPLPPHYFAGCPELESNVPLEPDGEAIEGNTIGAFYNATVLEGLCGNIAEPGDDGVWYALIGEGEVVTVSTCTLFFPDFDTQVLIYTPTNQSTGCRGGMDCVASNDNFCGLQSSVTFIAQYDTLYFIYVNGLSSAPAPGMDASEGEYSLTVSTSPEGSCQGAYDLEIAPAGSLPVIVVNELIGGTFGVDPCNPELESRTGELWYKVVGTGQVAVATTCHSMSMFQARLAVYRGFCDDLMCITSEDEDCGSGSEISWFAEAGKEYFLLVYTENFVPDVQFGISIQEIV